LLALPTIAARAAAISSRTIFRNLFSISGEELRAASKLSFTLRILSPKLNPITSKP
jgi:hypothetical protein